mmetsp:Transcript_19405/g.54053  ORF Transcript_19405/g.54053 Transcript_19405/m.54053 type:complete len:84 (+) Transcript_19405:607-858(+)
MHPRVAEASSVLSANDGREAQVVKAKPELSQFSTLKRAARASGPHFASCDAHLPEGDLSAAAASRASKGHLSHCQARGGVGGL